MRRRLIRLGPAVAPVPIDGPGFLNAWLVDDGATMIALEVAPDGTRVRRRQRAEWSCFLHAADVSIEMRRALSRSRAVVGFAAEGDWVRVRWRDRGVRHNACKTSDDRKRQGWFQTQGVEVFEGDVDPVMRWLADRDPKIARPRRCYLDIETDSRLPFSKKHLMRVLCWCVIDEQGNQTVGVLDRDEDEDERRVLRELFEHLEGFDQICAWHGDGFDFPVIRARAKHCKVKAEIDRWLWLDHMAWFKKANVMAAESGEEKQSFALQNIAMQIVGEGKDDFDASQTWEAWATTPCRSGDCKACRSCMVRYCRHDTDLLRRIEDETGYIDLLQTVCGACGLFADRRGTFPQARVDAFMLRMGGKEGHRFPTKHHVDEEDRQAFRGAFVMKPTQLGILHDVHVADFKSLYPSIIISWNMSPDTKIRKPEPTRAGIPLSSCPTYYSHYPIVEPVKPAHALEVPITGVWFERDRRGMLPRAVGALVGLRDEWKRRKKAAVPKSDEWTQANRMSTAYKIAANAFYGVMGQQSGRFFDVDVAESVAQAGVWLIKETIAEAERSGFRIVYGDSVTGDRTVVVMDPSGDVRMLPIAELWSRSELSLRDDEKKEQAVPMGWQALTERGWCSITGIIRHRANKATYRISTKHGQTRVTSDHGIMVDGVETTPLQFIQDGARFTTVAPHAPRPTDRIDLAKYVAGFTYTHKDGRVRTLVAKDDRIVLDGWADNDSSFRRFFDKGTPEWDALIRLVAAYVCDGSVSLAGVTTTRCMLSFCKANEELMIQLADDLSSMIEGSKVYGPYWTETVFVVRSGTVLASCLFAALCGIGSKNKRLPPFVFDFDRADVATLIDGLTKGDGSIDPAGQLCFTTTSQQLAAGVSYVLAQHDKPHGFHFRESKGAWAIRTRKGKERPSRYTVKVERRDPDPNEWVYDLSVDGAHTFVDGVGRVLLHNTDALLVTGCTHDAFKLFVERCNAELYPRWLTAIGIANNQIVLDFEKSFARMILVVKKRYAAKFSHYGGTAATAASKPEIKGLEFVRGDTVRLCRTMQAEVIHKLLSDDQGWDDPATYAEIAERWIAQIMGEPLDVDDVILSKSLSQNIGSYKRREKKDGTLGKLLPHLEIALQLRKRGADVSQGTKISYFCADGKAGTYLHVSEWQGECDRHELWEGQVWPATRRVLAAAFPAEPWDRYDRTRPAAVRAPRGKGTAGRALAAKAGGQGSLFD